MSRRIPVPMLQQAAAAEAKRRAQQQPTPGMQVQAVALETPQGKMIMVNMEYPPLGIAFQITPTDAKRIGAQLQKLGEAAESVIVAPAGVVGARLVSED